MVMFAIMCQSGAHCSDEIKKFQRDSHLRPTLHICLSLFLLHSPNFPLPCCLEYFSGKVETELLRTVFSTHWVMTHERLVKIIVINKKRKTYHPTLFCNIISFL